MLERLFVSKVAVLVGDSLLDDMEGWGDELMLRRACAAGGGWPNSRDENIRAKKGVCQLLPSVVGAHQT